MPIFTTKSDMGRVDPGKQSLYVIHNPQWSLVKVGISKSVSKRLGQIQSASGCKMELAYRSPVFNNADEIESNIHRHLHKDRTYGEWFTTPLGEVLEYVKEAVKEGDMDERVEMYVNGDSISSIAKKMGVSRQAIISYLRYYGSYRKGFNKVDDARGGTAPLPKTPLKSGVDTNASSKIREVPEVDFAKLGKKLVHIADHLYANEDGYLVKYWKDGGFVEKWYSSRGSILKEYGIK